VTTSDNSLARRLRATATAAVPILLLLSLTPAVANAGSSASTNRTLSLYAVVTRAQYVDYSDGITRAKYQNPFAIDSNKFKPTTGKGVASPGNSAFFEFRLYSDPAHTHPAGTAIYNCSFAFNNHATCEAEYQLANGTLFASGPIDFASNRSLLAVTGGAGTYLGLAGQVTAQGFTDTTGKSGTHLTFVLTG
jgi:hypothetical protein